MTEKLTMKALKAQLDELEARIDARDPVTPDDDGVVIASTVDISEFERIQTAIDEIRTELDSFKEEDIKRLRYMEELKAASNEDMKLIAKLESQEASIAELRKKLETMSEELGEASTVVQGLRATADTDMDAKTLQDKRIAEMKAQAEQLFSRMTRAEAKAQESEERFERFQKERRNEGLFVGILAACATGVALVILALALAGMI